MLGLTVIGIVYSALWYLFWIGVIAVGGVAAYKFLNKSEAKQMEQKEPIAISELRQRRQNSRRI